MKKLLLMICCSSIGYLANAQNPSSEKPSYKIITLDTINIRGYVYDFDGTPAVAADVRSTQRDTASSNDYFPLVTRTDKNGFFKINGAKLNDQIQVDGSLSFANKGSRYMVIYLPMPQQPITTLEVTAKKTHVKPSVSYTIKLPAEEKGVWYEWFEKEPEFPGGFDKFKNMILSKIIYPASAIENNVEGTVEVAFIVFKSGAITDVKILKGLGYGCEDEIVKILKDSPKWKPAIDGWRPIDVRFVIDLDFKLTN